MLSFYPSIVLLFFAFGAVAVDGSGAIARARKLTGKLLTPEEVLLEGRNCCDARAS